VADRAREQMDWVQNGENAVNISGLELEQSSTKLPDDIPANSIELPSSWITDFLDDFFSMPEQAEEPEVADPFTS